MRDLWQRRRWRNANVSPQIHDPQHPTLHLNLYLLPSFAALISTLHLRSLWVFVAKRQSPASAERATCCLPVRLAFKILHSPLQHLHTRGPQHQFYLEVVADLGLFGLSCHSYCCCHTSISRSLPLFGTGRQSSEKYHPVFLGCSSLVAYTCLAPHIPSIHTASLEDPFKLTYPRTRRLYPERDPWSLH